MSDLTAELNLALCVDNDDTADYLTQTAGLRGSLTTIDGLFSSTTGHNHSGAHQGGNFTSLNLSGALTVGGNLQVSGTTVVSGATTLQSLNVTTTSQLQGAVTLGATLAVTGALTVTGAATFSSSIVAGGVQSNGWIACGTNISGTTGDITANRGNGTGYVFLGNAQHLVGFDGTNYQLPTSWLYVNGDRAVTESATQTLSGKTLSGPVINNAAINNGTINSPSIFSPSITWSVPQSFVAPSKQNGLNLASLVNSQDWIIDYGQTPLVSVANGGLANYGVSFNRAFSANPLVILSIQFFSGAVASVPSIGCVGHNISTSGFQIDFGNSSGGGQSIVASWIAFGR